LLAPVNSNGSAETETEVDVMMRNTSDEDGSCEFPGAD